MLIKSETLLYFEPAHYGKTGAVGKTVTLVVPVDEQVPCRCFICLRYPCALDLGRIEENCANPDGCYVAETGLNKCNDFIEYIVGDNQFAAKRGKECLYLFMVGVSAIYSMRKWRSYRERAVPSFFSVKHPVVVPAVCLTVFSDTLERRKRKGAGPGGIAVNELSQYL
jgi:hypothetical protein